MTISTGFVDGLDESSGRLRAYFEPPMWQIPTLSMRGGIILIGDSVRQTYIIPVNKDTPPRRSTDCVLRGMPFLANLMKSRGVKTRF